MVFTPLTRFWNPIDDTIKSLAGVSENRTHPGREHRPTAGFEDQEGHQAPATPL